MVGWATEWWWLWWLKRTAVAGFFSRVGSPTNGMDSVSSFPVANTKYSATIQLLESVSRDRHVGFVVRAGRIGVAALTAAAANTIMYVVNNVQCSSSVAKGKGSDDVLNEIDFHDLWESVPLLLPQAIPSTVFIGAPSHGL